MENDRLLYLRYLGIEPYALRTATESTSQMPHLSAIPPEDTVDSKPPTAAPSAVHPKPQDNAEMSPAWKTLTQQVAACRKCVLHTSRTQTVFGTGNQQAQWMFIGEAPGRDEDRRGEPFVGRAGQLLTKMIAALGFSRSEVYIANIVKCRPPDNRNPRGEEITQCLSYLQRQIQLVQPKVIVLLGGVAAASLLKVQTPVSKLRGLVHRIDGSDAAIIVTYHPAYLLRAPHQKAAAWEDLQFARKTVDAHCVK